VNPLILAQMLAFASAPMAEAPYPEPREPEPDPEPRPREPVLVVEPPTAPIHRLTDHEQRCAWRRERATGADRERLARAEAKRERRGAKLLREVAGGR
jgi:hypothetical protein